MDKKKQPSHKTKRNRPSPPLPNTTVPASHQHPFFPFLLQTYQVIEIYCVVNGRGSRSTNVPRSHEMSNHQKLQPPLTCHYVNEELISRRYRVAKRFE